MKACARCLVSIGSGVLLTALTLWSQSALAGEVLPEIKASPEIYKVIAEDDDLRVILATWGPGVKDKMHSHPNKFMVHFLTDCHRKLHGMNGKVKEKNVKAGKTAIKDPVKAHVFENVGSEECRILMVEKRK